jgi:hypothetical protein
MKKAAKRTLTVVGAAVAVPVLVMGLVMLFLLSRFGMMAVKIDVAGGDRCWNVPETATNIYAKGSYHAFAAEFEITEKDFVDYCRTRNWTLVEIAAPVSMTTYRAYADGDAGRRDVTITMGLVHDGLDHRGGFKVVFDRATGKGFLEYSKN